MPKPKINKKAPQFTATALIKGNIETLSLSQYVGKYVILLFYPLDFTFTSPTEIIAFSNALTEFANYKTDIIAISCDSVYAHLAWTKIPRDEGGVGDIDIPLVSDKNAKICKSYGVFNENTGIPYRGIFIIDDQQDIRQSTINDLPIGRSIQETLRLIQAIQKSDETGEECPIDWMPGMTTIIPDPQHSQKYFQENYKIII